MLRSALLILSGNSMTFLLTLIRNLVIARLVSVEDYGVAATFAIAMTVVEMMSALGLQQQIVQSKDGDDPYFQSALQGFQVLRGAIAAAVLFFAAESIAWFFGIPEAAWAYQVLALVPLLNAFQHFDIHRLNRQMRFGPVIMTFTLPAFVSVLSVWPLSLWFGDYRVMLWAIMIQMTLMAVVSHFVAERPYRLVFDRKIMGGSLRFGWPILVNGILLFGVFNGDKLIVGGELGLELLAIFAMGTTLTLTPTLVMAKSAREFFLPQLSAVAEPANPKFVHLSRLTIETIMLMGMLLVLGAALFGELFVYLLLGEKYAALMPLIIWFTILQAIRVFKNGPEIVAFAMGHTTTSMIANLPRVLSLPVAWYVATTSGDLLMIIYVGIAGEVLGHAVVLGLYWYRTRISLQPLLWPHLCAVALLGVAGLQALVLSGTEDPSWMTRLIFGGLLIALFVLALWLMQSTRQMLQAKFSRA